MAKDTEKLIRQLSLISYLMAERRPVTATEIRRDVEGYSDMTEDAFARRFYADRAELDALGIQLRVDKPAEGFSEQENYSLAPEAFHLPAIAFTDEEHAALQTALSLLDGEFAYAEPLRLALQQITWGRPSPFDSAAQRCVALGHVGERRRRASSPPAWRRSTPRSRAASGSSSSTSRCSRARSPRAASTPTCCCSRAGQFYLVGYSHERDDVRVFRLSRIRGKVAYATKAEHDFQRPADFDPREYASRIPWQLGDRVRTPPRSGCRTASPGTSSATSAPTARSPTGPSAPTTRSRGCVIAWVLGYGEHARITGPPELAAEARERLDAIVERHTGEPFTSVAEGTPPGAEDPEAAEAPARSRQEAAIRPERFARLVTLASVLIAAGRAGRRPPVSEVTDRLQITEQELREDISVLNVVNFGGGAYVIYAEVQGDEIEIDTEPYSDTFDRPARLLPIEANALMAAIEFLGTHLSDHLADGPRQDQGRARRDRPRRPAGRRHRRRRLRHRARRQPRDRVAQPDRARVLAAERGHDLRAQGRAVRADERARGLVHRLLRPVARRHALVPARPREARDGARRGLRAARERRRDRGRRGLAAHRRGRGLAGRPRVDLARAGALGPRGAHACWPSCPTAR